MRPSLAPSELKHTKPWEYAVRFGFGGAIAVLTGVLGHAYGPWLAGLFLAFPAILPASLTLVKQHDGRAKAIDDARGARIGALGLGAFAAVVIALTGRAPAAVVLALATLAWLAASLILWFARYGREPRREHEQR